MFEFNTLSIGAPSTDRKASSSDSHAVAFLLPAATPKSEPNLKSSYIFPATGILPFFGYFWNSNLIPGPERATIRPG